MNNGNLKYHSCEGRNPENVGAVSTKRPPKGLIHHSDRGSQHCSSDYQKLIEQFGLTSSMSRKGNCYDNAPMESFWGTLKQELVHHRRYHTRQEAIQDITEYIEIFYMSHLVSTIDIRPQ